MKTKEQLRQEIRNVRTATNDVILRERLQSLFNGIVDSLGSGGVPAFVNKTINELQDKVAELEARVAALEPKEHTRAEGDDGETDNGTDSETEN